MTLRVWVTVGLLLGLGSTVWAGFDEAQCQQLLAGFSGKLSRGLYNELRTQPGRTKITAYLQLSEKAAVELGADSTGVLKVTATKDKLLELMEQLGNAHLNFASLQPQMNIVFKLPDLAKPPLVIRLRKKPQPTAAELKNWKPSSHVTTLFERTPELKELLSKAPTDIVHVEFGYGHDLSRELTGPVPSPGDASYEWWMAWLAEQFASNPEEIAVYQEVIPLLQMMHGEDLHKLGAQGVEILKPTSHNMIYGTFGVRGPLHILAAALDEKPSIIPMPPKLSNTHYVVRFDSKVNFDAANSAFKRLDVKVLNFYVEAGEDSIIAMIDAPDKAIEELRKLEGLEHLSKK